MNASELHHSHQQFCEAEGIPESDKVRTDLLRKAWFALYRTEASGCDPEAAVIRAMGRRFAATVRKRRFENKKRERLYDLFSEIYPDAEEGKRMARRILAVDRKRPGIAWQVADVTPEHRRAFASLNRLTLRPPTFSQKPIPTWAEHFLSTTLDHEGRLVMNEEASKFVYKAVKGVTSPEKPTQDQLQEAWRALFDARGRYEPRDEDDCVDEYCLPAWVKVRMQGAVRNQFAAEGRIPRGRSLNGNDDETPAVAKLLADEWAKLFAATLVEGTEGRKFVDAVLAADPYHKQRTPAQCWASAGVASNSAKRTRNFVADARWVLAYRLRDFLRRTNRDDLIDRLEVGYRKIDRERASCSKTAECNIVGRR